MGIIFKSQHIKWVITPLSEKMITFNIISLGKCLLGSKPIIREKAERKIRCRLKICVYVETRQNPQLHKREY